jgi:hypothetical protein
MEAARNDNGAELALTLATGAECAELTDAERSAAAAEAERIAAELDLNLPALLPYWLREVTPVG